MFFSRGFSGMNIKKKKNCHLLQPAPPAPLQEVSLTQDPLGVTQTLDPSLLSAGDPPTPREESTELPLLEHLR